MSAVIAAERVLLDGRLVQGYVVVEDGLVVATGTGSPPVRADRTLTDGILSPGFVDLQVNGAVGIDLVRAVPDDWAMLSLALARTGCTAFVPTFTTADETTLAGALGVHAHIADTLPGAQSLGVHLEGPFLASSQRGAHPNEQLREPDVLEVARLLDAAQGRLTYLTLAPELDGALDLIGWLREAGVRIAVGHSGASHDEVVAATDAGATIVTHLFNAQSGWHHREPGVVGAALTDDRLVCGLIADGHHVHAAGVRLAFAAAAGRIALVTDATSAAGMPAGDYELGGEPVHVAAGGPPRRTDGTLAGSSLTMDRAVANVVAIGIGIEDALTAATGVPAQAVGALDRGRIETGCRADLVWLADNLRPRATWVAGCLIDQGDRS